MPYVALGSSARGTRLTSAAPRWEAILRARPDLEPAVALQRRLVGVLVDRLDALDRGGVPRLSLPARYLAAKLERALPAFSGERVPMPVQTLGPALLDICDILAAGGAGDAAAHVATVLRDGSLDTGSLLSASFARDRHAIMSGATHRGLSPDLVWLAAELAASPFAHALQQRHVRPEADPALDAALNHWPCGYCPACGSWPALAERLPDRDVLRCSFCALAWTLAAGTCVYCGDPDAAMAVPHGEVSGGHVLQTCRKCGGYLKGTPVDALSPFPLLAIADLETMDLDVFAMEQGFHRPDLREFAAAR
jgi:FdhE protein